MCEQRCLWCEYNHISSFFSCAGKRKKWKGDEEVKEEYFVCRCLSLPIVII